MQSIEEHEMPQTQTIYTAQHNASHRTQRATRQQEYDKSRATSSLFLRLQN